MISIRPQTTGDNEQLCALASSIYMPGRIALRTHRDPEFSLLAKMRGDTQTLIADCNGVIAGCISLHHFRGYIGGRMARIGYIGDLKVRPEHRGGRTTGALIAAVAELAIAEPADAYWCVIARGNAAAMKLVKGRIGLPRFRQAGRFNVYQCFPRRHAVRTALTIETAGADSLRAIASLRNGFNARYELAPIVRAEDAPNNVWSINGVSRRVLVAKRSSTIVATLVLCDLTGAKQHEVVAMPQLLGSAMRALTAVGKVMPALCVPTLGTTVDMLYIREWAHAPGEMDALRTLLQWARHEAYQQKKSFVSLGVHERDPLNVCIPRIHVTFQSTGWIAGDDKVCGSIMRGVPMEDFALV